MGCEDTRHSYFVAEAVGDQREGKVTVIAVCTKCGQFINHTVQVSGGGSPLILRSETKRAA